MAVAPPLGPLTKPCLVCLAADFDFPSLNAPGFPTMMLGGLTAQFAGIDLILPFLELDPSKLPDLKLPKSDLFLKAYFGGAIGMPALPSASIGGFNIDGVDIPKLSTPAIGGINIPNFDPSIIFKLMAVFIFAPFVFFFKIITDLLNLKIAIPDLQKIILDVGLAVGIPKITMPKLSNCIFKSLGELNEQFLPV